MGVEQIDIFRIDGTQRDNPLGRRPGILSDGPRRGTDDNYDKKQV